MGPVCSVSILSSFFTSTHGVVGDIARGEHFFLHERHGGEFLRDLARGGIDEQDLTIPTCCGDRFAIRAKVTLNTPFRHRRGTELLHVLMIQSSSSFCLLPFTVSTIFFTSGGMSLEYSLFNQMLIVPLPSNDAPAAMRLPSGAKSTPKMHLHRGEFTG